MFGTGWGVGMKKSRRDGSRWDLFERERGEDEKYESLPEDIAACAPVLRSTNILCAFRIPEMLRLMVNSL